MIRSTSTARALFASMAVLATLSVSAAAGAVPDQKTPAPSSSVGARCLLERIGTQYVRCDDLTGLGAAAPEWIPEQ